MMDFGNDADNDCILMDLEQQQEAPGLVDMLDNSNSFVTDASMVLSVPDPPAAEQSLPTQ